jgi:hypothetical protein
MTLPVLDQPGHPCHQHRCDRCARCLAGECCGNDVIDANLPVEGSWSGKLHAPIGELVERNGLVICHMCGTGHVLLVQHLRHRHKMTGDEYRALFGLAARRALVPKWESERRSEVSILRTDGMRIPPRPTREQASRIAYAREQRAETKKKRGEQLTAEHQRAAAWARWQRPEAKVLARLRPRDGIKEVPS